jgi:hypothetical protein
MSEVSAVQAVTPKTQIGRILVVMADNKWRTEQVIRETLEKNYPGIPITGSLPAQLRDIRKKAGYTVASEKIKEGVRGFWQYRVGKSEQLDAPFVPTTFGAALSDTGCGDII